MTPISFLLALTAAQASGQPATHSEASMSVPVSRPKPLNRTAWVELGDYPPDALMHNQEGQVDFSLDISAEGKVSGCRIIGSSGVPALDAATCQLINKRAKFVPAVNAGGQPIPSTYLSTIYWMIPRNAITSDYPSLAFARREEGTVGIKLHFAADGTVANCDVEKSSGYPDLDAGTCEVYRHILFTGERSDAGRTSTTIVHWKLPRWLRPLPPTPN